MKPTFSRAWKAGLRTSVSFGACMRAGAFVAFVGLFACKSSSTGAFAEAQPGHATKALGSVRRNVGVDPGGVGAGTPLAPKPGHELAAFAGGCFWGVEDTFRQVPGVVATAVGYTGGTVPNPNYELVCTHTTGHAEAVLVEFDPAKVSYEGLLGVFFKNHDPTTKNRQGPDVGDQYRSAVFTLTATQAELAKKAILAEEKRLGKHVVTDVSVLGPFYKAEEYHQQYDEKTGTHSCPIGLPSGT
ncbi:MAG: peptide-methionine (S)-S-oxide reductase MsrA [Polyangiaceae bacterium]